jgi:regulator of sigma E protease
LGHISAFGKDSPAKSAGVQIGDEFIGVDSIRFTFFDEYKKYLAENKNKTIVLNLERNGKNLDLKAKPNSAGFLLINSPDWSKALEFKTLNYGFIESIPAGISKGFKTISDYLKQFKLIFSRGSKAYESLGGFITIGNIFPGYWDWGAFWNLTAFLSIILAVMNILPIPALDGGHVMFLLFEVVTGRKPSDKFLEYAQIVGMVILFSLLIYANGNDLLRYFRK